MAYDDQNIFAKILRDEIPCDKVFEDEHTLAFNDIQPQAPTHVLVIPKGAYVSMDDFSQNATDAEIAALWRTVGRVAREVGVADKGYRFLGNAGETAIILPGARLEQFNRRCLGQRYIFIVGTTHGITVRIGTTGRGGI